VKGHGGIREALSGFVAAKPHITLTPRVVAQTGDLALVSAEWQLNLTGADGKPAATSGKSVEVVRRQRDGTWLFAMDEPFGV
jgi:ketosteroid isomerase-like protein